jgi:hypothetical protein
LLNDLKLAKEKEKARKDKKQEKRIIKERE